MLFSMTDFFDFFLLFLILLCLFIFKEISFLKLKWFNFFVSLGELSIFDFLCLSIFKRDFLHKIRIHFFMSIFKGVS